MSKILKVRKHKKNRLPHLNFFFHIRIPPPIKNLPLIGGGILERGGILKWNCIDVFSRVWTENQTLTRKTKNGRKSRKKDISIQIFFLAPQRCPLTGLQHEISQITSPFLSSNFRFLRFYNVGGRR